MIPVKKHRIFYKRKRLKTTYMFSQDDINKVLYNVRSHEVISDFVPLRLAKVNYVGRCPFCKIMTKNDTHFIVSKRKGLYKCFECGRGGANAVSFIMMYFDEPFDKVIEFLDKNYTKTGIKPNRMRFVRKRTDIDEGLPF